MKTVELKLAWLGNRNEPVTLVEKVNGGWLVRLENGMIVGPIEEGLSTLR